MCDGVCSMCIFARRCAAERALLDASTPAIAWPPRVFLVSPQGEAEKCSPERVELMRVNDADFEAWVLDGILAVQ